MITEVSKITGIPELVILESREYRNCEIRQLYWKLLHMHGFSYNKIARLSGKEHATIISGIKHVDDLMSAGDKQLTAYWNKIQQIKHK